jgi:UbiD family decarboxylase
MSSTVAGGLVGSPINVVRAKTVDLLVPAEAEIVIEGYIDTEYLEPEAPFGESHGHVNLQEYNAYMDVTCDHAQARSRSSPRSSRR